MKSRPKLVAFVLGVVVAALAAGELAHPAQTNPAVDASHTLQAQTGTPPALIAVVDRACGDCHSNATDWSRYPRSGPVAWIVARGITQGRRAVNFSEWTSYAPDVRRALLVASCTDARRGTMPMPAYLRLRPDARLSAGDVETICAASSQAASPPSTASHAAPAARSEP